MATKSAAPILLLGGVVALILMTRKKSEPAVNGKKINGTNGHKVNGENGHPEPDDDFEEEEPPVAAEESYEELMAEWEDADGRPMLGKFYQVRDGDTLLAICREALFGSRELRLEAWERQAVVDLSIRIDCGPWNQAVYGRGAGELEPGHRAVENGWSSVGVAFAPIFQDNRARLAQGLPPTAAPGDSYPEIWISMIDLDAFDAERTVTTMGQNWPDDGDGEYSMINPPPWVIDLAFDEIASMEVGCNLPEGDFRKTMQPNQV